MYTAGTILTRSVPLEAPEGQDAHPLNKIRVVGPSPVASPTHESWSGISGDCVIITPADEFGANEVAPVKALQAEYDVSDYVEPPNTLKKVELDPPNHIKGQPLESPEEVFARQNREAMKVQRAEAAAEAQADAERAARAAEVAAKAEAEAQRNAAKGKGTGSESA